MDIEKAREILKNSGYQHPKTHAYNNTKKYKTFDSKTKNDNPYKSSSTVTTYAKNNKNEIMICPVCKETALYSCDCKHADKMCKNQHVWYLNEEGGITCSDPHED